MYYLDRALKNKSHNLTPPKSSKVYKQFRDSSFHNSLYLRALTDNTSSMWWKSNEDGEREVKPWLYNL